MLVLGRLRGILLQAASARLWAIAAVALMPAIGKKRAQAFRE